MERIVVLAHQIEAMARQEKLQPLDHYLKPFRPKHGDGSDELTDFFDREIARQGRVGHRRPDRHLNKKD